MKRLRQMATGALCATAVILPLLGAGAAQATNRANALTQLTLKNGWTNAPFGTSNAAVQTVSGIVHLKGAIATGGTNPVPFTLPVAFRPATTGRQEPRRGHSRSERTSPGSQRANRPAPGTHLGFGQSRIRRRTAQFGTCIAAEYQNDRFGRMR